MTDDSKVNVTPQKIQHKNIYEALSAFQGEMKPIEKDGQVKFKMKNSDEIVDFKYTTLGKVMEIINPVLGKHGLSVRWEINEKTIECVVNHETTEEKSFLKETSSQSSVSSSKEEKFEIIKTNQIASGKLPIDLTKSDMKDVGGQMTYGRRYTLGLALGIATEEDKDAELMEDKLVASQKFAFTQAKKGIDNAKTVEDVEKGIDIIKKDLERLIKKEKTTLGLEEKQYQDLIKLGQDKVANLEANQTNK